YAVHNCEASAASPPRRSSDLVMQTMTRSAARRTAIAATGLDRPRPATVTARHLRSVFATMGVTQIDSVARVIRSHYLPPNRSARSEEHTSELQSRFDLVCRLM